MTLDASGHASRLVQIPRFYSVNDAVMEINPVALTAIALMADVQILSPDFTVVDDFTLKTNFKGSIFFGVNVVGESDDLGVDMRMTPRGFFVKDGGVVGSPVGLGYYRNAASSVDSGGSGFGLFNCELGTEFQIKVQETVLSGTIEVLVGDGSVVIARLS